MLRPSEPVSIPRDVAEDPALSRQSGAPGGPARRNSRFIIILLLLFCAGTISGALVSTYVFERIPHVEDEQALLFQARVFASGRFYVPAPPSADLFRIPFVLDVAGRRMGKYPPGFPLLLALGVLAGAPWLVNPTLAGLGLVSIALLGTVLFDRRTGLIAALLALGSPFFLLSAGSLMSHSTTLFTLTLGAALLVQSVRPSGRAGWAVGAGACLGFALMTRPLTAIGVSLPVIAGTAAIGMHRPARLGQSAMLACLGAAPVLVFFVVWNTVALGGPFQSGYELWWGFDRVGFGTGPNGDFGPALAWDGITANAREFAAWLFGWPGNWSLGLAVIPFLLSPRNRTVWMLLAWAVALSLVHGLYWAPGEMYGPRYLYEALPPLLILSARGVLLGAQLLAPRLARLPVPRIAWSAATVLALFAAVVLFGWPFFREQSMHYQGWYNIRREVFDRVDQAVQRPAVVFVQMNAWTDYANFSWSNDPLLQGPVVYAIDLTPERRRRLLTELPSGGAPRRVYLYDQFGLIPTQIPP